MNPVGSASLKAVLLAGMATPVFAFLIEMALAARDPLDGGVAFIALPAAMLITALALLLLAFPLTLFVDVGPSGRFLATILTCLGVGVGLTLFFFSQDHAAARVFGLHALVGTLGYCVSYALLRKAVELDA